MIELYDKIGKPIKLENYRTDYQVQGTGNIRVYIVNRIAIITFEGHSIKTTNAGDLFSIPIINGYTVKSKVYFSLFTNAKTPQPIMCWIDGNKVYGFSLTEEMQVIGTVVVELA